MIVRNDCIQFYVESSKGNLYILHEDEVDITGMCRDQLHCSGKFIKSSPFRIIDEKMLLKFIYKLLQKCNVYFGKNAIKILTATI